MNIASFLVYCVIVTFSPGPTNIVILSAVHNFGIKKAMRYVWGATAAFGLLLVISVVLNSMLMAVIPKILFVMQIIGSIYMLYLAYQINKPNVSEGDARQIATFKTGFLMQFINPKVIMFTMTVIPGFVMPYHTSPGILVLAVAAVSTVGFLAFGTWVLFGTIFKEFLQKYHKVVNIMMGLFLVYAAIILSGLVELLAG